MRGTLALAGRSAVFKRLLEVTIFASNVEYYSKDEASVVTITKNRINPVVLPNKFSVPLRLLYWFPFFNGKLTGGGRYPEC